MKAVGILLAGGSNEARMGELTRYRAVAAMPVGGSYRAIDFPLSNMANSGIGKVAVITQYNSRSLHDHLISSKWWDFGRKQGGLFVFAPFISRDNSSWFRGTADSMYQNITFLKRSNEPYVVIASGDSICKIDYNRVLRYHEEKGADITIVCKDMSGHDLTKFGLMEMDEDGRIVNFEEKPLEPFSKMASLGMYIVSRKLLIDLLEISNAEGRYDFVRDVLVRYRRKLKLYAYEHMGYFSNVGGGIEEYYATNMDFLQKDIRDLFTRENPYTATKPKDEPPAKFNSWAEVRDSLVGGGAILNGVVEHSVLFRRVYTGEGSMVRDSILMEGCRIGNNCVVMHAILDKNVTISDGKRLIGKEGAPLIIGKGTVL